MSKQATMTKDWTDQAVTMHDLNDLKISVSDFPEDMQERFALHGLIQKVRDALAGMSLKKGHTVADREKAALEVVEHLLDGSWSKPAADKITKAEGISRLVAQEGISEEEATRIWDILHKA